MVESMLTLFAHIGVTVLAGIGGSVILGELLDWIDPLGDDDF